MYLESFLFKKESELTEEDFFCEGCINLFYFSALSWQKFLASFFKVELKLI